MLTDWIASDNTGNGEAKRELRASFVYAEAEVAEVYTGKNISYSKFHYDKITTSKYKVACTINDQTMENII